MTGAQKKISSRFASSVEGLEVYKLAYNLSLEIHKASLEFPKIEQYELASQIRRSTKSIVANLAEGYAKRSQSQPEFSRFISLAIGSAGEVNTWLHYVRDLKYLHSDQTDRLQDQYDKVVRMLQNLRTSLLSNRMTNYE